MQSEVERAYGRLLAEKIEVLYDDRPLRAGETFGDADLIGLPVRLTISKRTLQKGKVEYKRRHAATSEMIALDEAIQRLKALGQSR